MGGCAIDQSGPVRGVHHECTLCVLRARLLHWWLFSVGLFQPPGGVCKLRDNAIKHESFRVVGLPAQLPPPRLPPQLRARARPATRGQPCKACKGIARPCKGFARPCKGLAKACKGFAKACKGLQWSCKPIYIYIHIVYVGKLSLLFWQNTWGKHVLDIFLGYQRLSHQQSICRKLRPLHVGGTC